MSSEPRRKALKRAFSATVDTILETNQALFPDNTTKISVFADKGAIELNSETIQTERKSILQQTFMPIIPTTVLSNEIPILMQPKCDAQLTLYRKVPSAQMQYMNSFNVFFNGENDTWSLSHCTSSDEYYWTLKSDAKLAAVDCWLKDDVLLGAIAEKVQKRIAEIGDAAKASFVTNQK